MSGRSACERAIGTSNCHRSSDRRAPGCVQPRWSLDRLRSSSHLPGPSPSLPAMPMPVFPMSSCCLGAHAHAGLLAEKSLRVIATVKAATKVSWQTAQLISSFRSFTQPPCNPNTHCVTYLFKGCVAWKCMGLEMLCRALWHDKHSKLHA